MKSLDCLPKSGLSAREIDCKMVGHRFGSSWDKRNSSSSLSDGTKGVVRWGFSSAILGLKRQLAEIAEGFVKGLEPKIVQRRDRAGNVYFQVYDPATQQSSTLESETEVRAWLESRYYR